MTYVIGVDSGGTKTESVLVDETGHIVLRDVSLGCNAMDIGEEEAKRRLEETLNRICAVSPEKVNAFYAGIAGTDYFGDFLQRHIRGVMDIPHVRIEDDGYCIITGTLGRVDGCAMICGTGCSLTLRTAGMEGRHIGGRGYLIDTGGSGFELGRAAIRHAFRAQEGRGEETVLVELCEKKLGTSLTKGMPAICNGGRAFVASFARLVFEGRERGDRLCHRVIDEETTKLAELTWAAEHHFPGEFSIVMNGGIFTAYPFYAEMVKAKASPRAKMVRGLVPPVYGSVVEAFADAGIDCFNEAFKETFMKDYAEWKKRQ